MAALTVVWHHNLTTAHSNQLAPCIILHPMTVPFNSALTYCEIKSLKLWLHSFQQKFFMTDLSSWKLPA